MSMKDTEKALLSMKDAALAASRTGDADFYDGYLADDAVAVVPGGVFGKDEIVAAMGKGDAFRSTKIEDVKATVLTPESGLVTYRATFDRPGGKSAEMFVTTVYRKDPEGWRGVFYQQTPLGNPASR